MVKVLLRRVGRDCVATLRGVSMQTYVYENIDMCIYITIVCHPYLPYPLCYISIVDGEGTAAASGSRLRRDAQRCENADICI